MIFLGTFQLVWSEISECNAIDLAIVLSPYDFFLSLSTSFTSFQITESMLSQRQSNHQLFISLFSLMVDRQSSYERYYIHKCLINLCIVLQQNAVNLAYRQPIDGKISAHVCVFYNLIIRLDVCLCLCLCYWGLSRSLFEHRHELIRTKNILFGEINFLDLFLCLCESISFSLFFNEHWFLIYTWFSEYMYWCVCVNCACFKPLILIFI